MGQNKLGCDARLICANESCLGEPGWAWTLRSDHGAEKKSRLRSCTGPALPRAPCTGCFPGPGRRKPRRPPQPHGPAGPPIHSRHANYVAHECMRYIHITRRVQLAHCREPDPASACTRRSTLPPPSSRVNRSAKSSGIPTELGALGTTGHRSPPWARLEKRIQAPETGAQKLRDPSSPRGSSCSLEGACHELSDRLCT